MNCRHKNGLLAPWARSFVAERIEHGGQLNTDQSLEFVPLGR